MLGRLKIVDIDKILTNFVKFLACIVIALHHYSQHAIGNSDGIIRSTLIPFSAYGGYFGVAIFFFLSGYGLSKSDQKRHLNFNDFCKRRIGKVYAPVLLSTMLWLPLYLHFVGWPHSCSALIYSILGGVFLAFLTMLCGLLEFCCFCIFCSFYIVSLGFILSFHI